MSKAVASSIGNPVHKYILDSPALKKLFKDYKERHAAQHHAAAYTRPPSICEENDFIVARKQLPLSKTKTIQVLPPDNSVEKKVCKISVINQGAKSEETNASPRFTETHIAVFNIDTVSAGLALGNDCCILSFANDETAGGFYRTGARAQEEDLCRTIPELYATLIVNNNKFYPLLPGEALLSQDLFVLRQPGDYTLVPELFQNEIGNAATKQQEKKQNDDDAKDEQEKPQDVPSFNFDSIPRLSVITCAMPRGLGHHRPQGGFMNPESEWHKTVSLRVHVILEAAKLSGKKDLVLGAAGAGAFGNPPQYVAQVFKEMLMTKCSDYRGCFDRIVFAIIDPMQTGNLKPFQVVFEAK